MKEKGLSLPMTCSQGHSRDGEGTGDVVRSNVPTQR